MGEELVGPVDGEEHISKRIPGSALYPMYYAAMIKTCRENGYALTVHGSLGKDLDLVAIPWTKEAVSPEVLVKALIEKNGLMEGNNTSGKEKPHGRQAWVFVFFGGQETGYIDLSIMPPSQSLIPTEPNAEKCPKCGDDLEMRRGPLSVGEKVLMCPNCKFEPQSVDRLSITCPDCQVFEEYIIPCDKHTFKIEASKDFGDNGERT